MNYPEISVIVPIYNVEQYLDQCVRSIQAQTFADIEIILIDDGSPDHCGEMCDAYAQEDSRIRVIHQENCGVSAARNAGIEAARGRYIGFVDGDDYIAPDMYEILRTMLEHEAADAAICGMSVCRADADNRAELSAELPSYRVVGAEEAIRFTLESNAVACFTKLCRAKIFSGVRFPENKATAEDAYFALRLLAKARKIAITSAEKYYYVQRGGSATSFTYGPHLWSTIELWEENLQFIKKEYPALTVQAEHMYLWSMFFVLDRMMLSAESIEPEKEEKLIQQIKENLGRIIKNPYFGCLRKVAAVSLLFHKGFYKSFTQRYWKKRDLRC